MKRSLSMLLAVFMVLSLAFVGVVSATAADVPDGFTGINSLSQITDPAGSYYLTADIGDAENPNTTTFESFSGTIDGGNHTIYTSVPLVAALNGATIKNVTIAGAITSTGTNIGVIANTSTGAVSFDKVINNATVTATQTGANADCPGIAGFVQLAVSGTVSITNSVNNANLSTTNTASVPTYSGGFIGYLKNDVTKLTLTNCANTGNVYAKTQNAGGTSSTVTVVGGLVGYDAALANTVADCSNSGHIQADAPAANSWSKAAGLICYLNAGGTFDRCVNTGRVESLCMSGGIVADTRKNTTCTDCINTGVIYTENEHTNSVKDANDKITDNVAASAGGIVCQAYNNTNTTFIRCANYGDVTGTNGSSNNTFAGGICATTNKHFSATDCIVYGDVTSKYIGGGIVGKCQLQTAWFERCIVTGTVTGSGYYGCGIAGNIGTTNTDESKYITIKDCFCSKAYAVGIYAKPSQTLGNVRYINTATGYDVTVVGGTGEVATQTNEWNVMVYYKNKFVAGGGQIASAAEATGANAAKKFAAFNFGSGTWILREGYPELAVAETLLGTSEKPAGEYTVNLEGQQQSLAVGETYALRFVSSVTSTAYDYVGVEVLVATSGNATVKTAGEKKSASVWEQILASADGVNSAYPAEPAVGTYYSALTLTDIPTTGTYTFIVTPYTEKDGAKTNGATAAIVYKDGALVTSYWFAAPAR